MKTKAQTILRKRERYMKRIARDLFAQSLDMLETFEYDESEIEELRDRLGRDTEAHNVH